MAKKVGEEKGISVCKAERKLDVNLFLDKLPRWEPGGFHHMYLYQRMFAHVKAAGESSMTAESARATGSHCQKETSG